jgi:hypothetical protein
LRFEFSLYRCSEAISINKSLFTLRKVITSLAESRYKGLHVPYRDSKVGLYT